MQLSCFKNKTKIKAIFGTFSFLIWQFGTEKNPENKKNSAKN
jgi:hypothetical protein